MRTRLLGTGNRDASVGMYQSLREEYTLDVSATQVGGLRN